MGAYVNLIDLIHTMNGKAEEFIKNAYESLKAGNEEAALGFLYEALRLDYEHQEVLYALKCLNWWLEKIYHIDDFYNPYEQGGYILAQWESYYEFLDRIGDTMLPIKEACDSCQYAVKRFVFSRALNCYLALLKDGINQQDPELLLYTARCYKGAGEWEEALRYLEQAGRFKRDDSAILSELADVNALLGGTRAAKVLFREAFYIDPQGVDLRGLESELIHSLLEKVRELGYTEEEIAEWIPVWGCIWGIFSVRRELKPVELGRLKQSILSLENEYRGSKSKSVQNALINPRLLNRYFWLIDHYENNRDSLGLDSLGLIEETMLKIKFIDPAVHERYRM
jgi:tetratricopeptide (TPR) repeat protein